MTPSPPAVDLVDRLEACAGRQWRDEQLVDADEARLYAELHGYRPPGAEVPFGYGAALTMRAVLLVLHDTDLAIPFDRNVHAAQDLEWLDRMQPGALVRTTAVVGNVRMRERAVFFDVLTTTTCRDDLVLRGVATQAVRHA